MSVRFILGRSGSGKTTHCINAIQNALSDSPVGPELLFLVPDQATFQMEQAVLSSEKLTGYHRCSIVSFNRLSQLLMFQADSLSLPVLSPTAKQMLLWRIYEQNKEHLSLFSQGAVSSGFIETMHAMLRECRFYQKTPEQLIDQAKDLKTSDDIRLKPLAEKLSDLSILFKAYENAIKDRFIDPDEYLDKTILRADLFKRFSGAQLWIDGFASFTPQQLALLTCLIKTVDHVDMSFCLDPFSETFSFLQKHHEFNGACKDDFFYPTLLTFQKLTQHFRDHDIDILAPLCLGEALPLPRYRHSQVLSDLEQGLFKNASTSLRDKKFQALKTFEEVPESGVVVVSATDRREEINLVAQQIIRLCRDCDYRYREIAIILRDFDDYQTILESVLTDYGIQFFIDQRRALHHHPLIECIQNIFHILISNFSSDHVLNYLKTDLAGIDRELVDPLENVVLSLGVEKAGWFRDWQLEDANGRDSKTNRSFGFTNETINQCRKKIIAPFYEFKQQLYDQESGDYQATVLQYSQALYQFLNDLNVCKKLKSWSQEAQEQGLLDQRDLHNQVYTDVMNLLDEMVVVMGDDKLSLQEYLDLLLTGLSQLSKGVVPPALDQVLIGSIERSRHPHIRAAFVLGVNEGRFPRLQTEPGFLTEDQRGVLSQRGFELSPGQTQQLLDERYLGYIALTRGQDFLWVSYSRVDDSGKTLNPSLLIEQIYNAVTDCPYLYCEQVNENDLSNMTEVWQLGQFLAGYFSSDSITLDDKSDMGALSQYALSVKDWQSSLEMSLKGLCARKTAHLDSSILPQLFPETSVSSTISRLECFAACQFQHYAKYILNLSSREQLKYEAKDIGNFYHQGLHELFQRLQEKKIKWADLASDELRLWVDEVLKKITSEDSDFYPLIQQSHRNHYIFSKASKQLHRMSQQIWRFFCDSCFDQVFSEVAFGLNHPIPGLVLNLPDGRQWQLHGKIDRVDCDFHDTGYAAVSVVDYKSSQHPLDLSLFYQGLSLQLMSYLQVMLNYYQQSVHQDSQPAAGLYMPIRHVPKLNNQYRSGDYHFDDQVDVDMIKAQGVINGQWASRLDKTVKAKSRSAYLPFYMNKDESPYGKSSRGALTPEQLTRFLNHNLLNLQRLMQNLFDGEISVNPYQYKTKTACDYCDYRSLCRFDERLDSFRFIPVIDKEQLLEKLTHAEEGMDG